MSHLLPVRVPSQLVNAPSEVAKITCALFSCLFTRAKNAKGAEGDYEILLDGSGQRGEHLVVFFRALELPAPPAGL